MLMKSIAAGVLGSALLASVAFAQSPTATTDRAETKAATTSASTQGEWRSSKMVGLKVYNDNKEDIGSINDLLMDQSGNIKTAVVGVGGFLGVGEHLVAIPFDKMKFSNESVSYGTASNMDKGNAANRPGASTTTGSATTSSSSSRWYPDHAVFNATKDDLKKMPEFKFTEASK